MPSLTCKKHLRLRLVWRKSPLAQSRMSQTAGLHQALGIREMKTTRWRTRVPIWKVYKNMEAGPALILATKDEITKQVCASPFEDLERLPTSVSESESTQHFAAREANPSQHISRSICQPQCHLSLCIPADSRRSVIDWPTNFVTRPVLSCISASRPRRGVVRTHFSNGRL